jgi:hypothetical protein
MSSESEADRCRHCLHPLGSGGPKSIALSYDGKPLRIGPICWSCETEWKLITGEEDGGLTRGTPSFLPLEPEAHLLTPDDREAASVRYQEYLKAWEEWVSQMLEELRP